VSQVPRSKPDLDALPPATVQPRGAHTVPELHAWAQRTGQRFREIKFSAGADKKSVLRSIAQALEFPAWFGANLDALYDSLTDLPDHAEQPARGWVIVLGALPGSPHLDAETRAALLDVFRDAAADFARRGMTLRVFYA
jgi:RNAse (barnase) inhibitor barstar